MRVFLIACAAFFLSACQEQIIHDLSEREANKIISHLSLANLDADKVLQPDGRWAIAVSRDSMIAALTYLDTQRVLSTRDAKPLQGKGSMIPSREEQWFRYERSVALSIEESLAALPGVLEARVHLNLPEEDPLFGTARRASGSGSVLLVVDERFEAQDEEVSALVGGAAGLSKDVVRVLKSRTIRPQVTQAKALEVKATDVVAPKAEPPQVAEAARTLAASLYVPWREGLIVAAALMGVLAARNMYASSKKKVAFALPKELDFEG